MSLDDQLDTGDGNALFERMNSQFYTTACITSGQACFRGNLHHLHIPNSGDLQRELRAFVFFPEDRGGQHWGSEPPYLRLMIRVRDVELSDKSHQERLHLNHAVRTGGCHQCK